MIFIFLYWWNLTIQSYYCSRAHQIPALKYNYPNPLSLALVKSLSRQQVRWPSLWIVLFYIFYCLAHFMRWTAFYKISNEVRNIRASWNDPNRVQFMQYKLFQTNSKILECVIGIKVIILNCSFKKRTLMNLVVSRKFFCKAQPLILQEKCHCITFWVKGHLFTFFLKWRKHNKYFAFNLSWLNNSWYKVHFV